MGSFILRCLHSLLWWSHAGIIYVDDFFFLFPKSIAGIMACICCNFAHVLNISISCCKTEFGPRVRGIEWQFQVTAGYIRLPTNKIDKLSEYISSMLRSSRTSETSLEKLMGLLNWITPISLLMRCWLLFPCCDLYHIPACYYRIDPAHWNHRRDCLDDTLQFVGKPTGTGIPIRSPLLTVRHQGVSGSADLFFQLYLSEVAFG